MRNLHTLVIPKRHVADAFELTDVEWTSLYALAKLAKADIQAADATVGGFNFGANVGRTAGQKIMHVHFHLIPRRDGDTPPPPAV